MILPMVFRSAGGSPASLLLNPNRRAACSTVMHSLALCLCLLMAIGCGKGAATTTTDSSTDASSPLAHLPPEHPLVMLEKLETNRQDVRQRRVQMKVQEQRARSQFLTELRKFGGESPALMAKLRGKVKDTEKEFALSQHYKVWGDALAAQKRLEEKDKRIGDNVTKLRTIAARRAIADIEKPTLSAEEQKEVDRIIAAADVDDGPPKPEDAVALTEAFKEVDAIITNSSRKQTAENLKISLKELPALPSVDATGSDDSEEVMLKRLKNVLLPQGRAVAQKLFTAGQIEESLLADIAGMQEAIKNLTAFPREPSWKRSTLTTLESAIQSENDLIGKPYHERAKDAAAENDFGTVLDMFELLMEKAPQYSKLEAVKQMVEDHLSVQEGVENIEAAAWQLRFELIINGPSSTDASSVLQGVGFGSSAFLKPGALKIIKIKGIETRWHWIPPGKFKMGSPSGEQGRDDDENQVDVTLSKGFWMLETEVTQELWTAVMGTTLDWGSAGKGPKHPVYNVSHDEATEFCEKFNALLKSIPGAARMSVSLPAEAQWEYAARAGTTTRFYWGDDEARLGDYAWYSGNSNRSTHPVEQKKENAWGLKDMSGNVWEWCSDWYGDTLTGGTDPRGAASASVRVERGGGWSYGGGCRSANRSGSVPGYRSNNLGFRLSSG